MANDEIKDPAVNWYFGNYYTSTRLMSQAERGAYMDVMAYLFEHGHLAHADVIKACEGIEYPKVFDKLSIDDDGLYYNRRLDKEIAKRKKNYLSKLNNLGSYIDEPPLKGKKKEPDITKYEELPPRDDTSTPGEENIQEEPVPKTVRFKPPTVIEVAEYCKERKNRVDPFDFVNFYESKGWMVGKNKMKDWKAAVRHWETNNKENKIDLGQHPGQIIVDGSVPASFKK